VLRERTLTWSRPFYWRWHLPCCFCNNHWLGGLGCDVHSNSQLLWWLLSCCHWLCCFGLNGCCRCRVQNRRRASGRCRSNRGGACRQSRRRCHWCVTCNPNYTTTTCVVPQTGDLADPECSTKCTVQWVVLTHLLLSAEASPTARWATGPTQMSDEVLDTHAHTHTLTWPLLLACLQAMS
jgi:hypothetical protein